MSALSSVLPSDPFNRRLLAGFLIMLAMSCINPPYMDNFGMQHAPTVLAVVALISLERRRYLDRTGFALIISFLLLHVLGARYLYSYVPYDDWSQYLFGVRIADRFGFERNHYDRLVHFCFGLMLTYPIMNFFQRQLRLENWWPAVLAVCFVGAASALYEIGEWLTALVVAPDWAEAYTGQQGDPWDAQCDMALAIVGALVASVFVAKKYRGEK